jgi:hypothetical protein
MSLQATAGVHRSAGRRPAAALVAGVVACAVAMGGTWFVWHQFSSGGKSGRCGAAHVSCDGFHWYGRPLINFGPRPQVIPVDRFDVPRPNGRLASDHTAAVTWVAGSEMEVDYASGVIETVGVSAPTSVSAASEFRQFAAHARPPLRSTRINGRPAVAVAADPSAHPRVLGISPARNWGAPAVVNVEVRGHRVDLLWFGRHPLRDLIALAATVR